MTSLPELKEEGERLMYWHKDLTVFVQKLYSEIEERDKEILSLKANYNFNAQLGIECCKIVLEQIDEIQSLKEEIKRLKQNAIPTRKE